MLPPLNLLALDTTLETDLNTRQGVQGREGAFCAAFTEMLALPSGATGAFAGPSGRQGASRGFPAVPGQALPPDGNALPVHGLSPALDAEAAALILQLPESPELPLTPESPLTLASSELPEPVALPLPVPVAEVLPAPPVLIQVAPGAGPLPGGVTSSAAASAWPAALLRDPAIAAMRTAAGETKPLDRSVETIAGAPARGLSVPPLLTGEAGGIPPELADATRLKTESPAAAFDLLLHAGSDADVAQHKGTLPASAPAPSPPPGVSTPVLQSATGAAALAMSSIDLPMSDPEWGDALGDRIIWMAGHKLKHAELRLSPAELGPVRVQIQVDDGAATIHFSAQHALTRDALEQALPRLREMLADQGLALGNANVTEHGAGQERNGADARVMEQPLLAGDVATGAAGEAIESAARIRRAAGLVDVFA